MEPPAKKRAQRDAVRVTDTRRHFVDPGIRGSQEMHGALDTQTLDGGQRRRPKDVLHAAGECPLAGSDSSCRIVE